MRPLHKILTRANWPRFAATIATAVGLLTSTAGEEAPPIDAPIHRLPRLVITEDREGLPWKYGRAGPFEVLTLCSEDLTRRFVAASLRGHLFFPEHLQAKWSTPVQIILFNHRTDAPETVEITPSDQRFGAGWQVFGDSMVVTDGDSVVIAANLRGIFEWPLVATDYAHTCLRALTPAAPTWLVEALVGKSGVYGSIGGYREKAGVRLPSFFWLSQQETDRIERDSDYQPRFVPLGELFAQSWPDESPESAAIRLRSTQAGLFARWALYGRKHGRSDPHAFWLFAVHACREPVTEPLFERCFGLDFAAASERMRAYLHQAIRGPEDFRVPEFHRDLPEVENAQFRLATETEVARIKANWERIQARELAESLPETARKYRHAARRTLRRGHRLGEASDPDLLNVSGLFEYEAGQWGRARVHLEHAAAAGAATTEALLALARLRLAEARRERPPEGRLNAAQLESVLSVLFAARARSPARREVYELIGQAWTEAQVQPGRGHLAVLIEGTRLFPNDATLFWTAADLHSRFGYRAKAAALATEGLERCRTPSLRQRFLALNAELAGQP